MRCRCRKLRLDGCLTGRRAVVGRCIFCLGRGVEILAVVRCNRGSPIRGLSQSGYICVLTLWLEYTVATCTQKYTKSLGGKVLNEGCRDSNILDIAAIPGPRIVRHGRPRQCWPLAIAMPNPWLQAAIDVVVYGWMLLST